LLSIDKIVQKEPNYSFVYTYRFPAIDFKFQNTGSATALLWKFSIKIIRAEIDMSPSFNFSMKVVDNNLQIGAINNGWGDAHDCSMRIEEHTLNKLFSEEERTFEGLIQSGEERPILTLTKQLAQKDKFEELSKEFSDIRLPTGIPIGVYGIQLEAPQIQWSCKNAKSERHEGDTKIKLFNEFFVTKDGFHVQYLSGAGLPSDITYSIIIDPSHGTQEQEYRISRKIPPGDVERFHIMVGSPCSCYLTLRFVFHVDAATKIESNVFNIQIWNPKNSGWHYQYKDGEALKKNIEEWPEGFPSNPWKPKSREDLEERLSNYPFLKDKEP